MNTVARLGSTYQLEILDDICEVISTIDESGIIDDQRIIDTDDGIDFEWGVDKFLNYLLGFTIGTKEIDFFSILPNGKILTKELREVTTGFESTEELDDSKVIDTTHMIDETDSIETLLSYLFGMTAIDVDVNRMSITDSGELYVNNIIEDSVLD